MRTTFLLPVTVVAVVAGCGSEGREQVTRSVPQRDLTLQAAALEVEIASPVELRHLRAQHQTAPIRRAASGARSRPIMPKPVLAVTTAPTLAAPASDELANPAGTATDQGNDRELPPGKTITVIPASSGPSTTTDWTDEFPTAKSGTMVVRGGGTCRPRGRGRGIGIAGFPRPRLR
jgi:hypothetical protein